jgi:hypothetical protein
MGKSAKPLNALSSKRKRADSALPPAKHSFARPLARAQAPASGPPGPSTIRPSGSGRLHSTSALLPLQSARRLKSAFRPPPPPPVQWSRDVPVTDYQFTRSTAQYLPSGDVTITRNSGKLEVITIANDWKRGEELYEKKESHYDSGFIGRGYSKRGIYVCSHPLA